MAKQSNLAKKEFYGYRILSVTEIRNESNITFGLTAEVLPAIKIGSQDESFYTNQIKIKVVCLKALIIRWAGFRPELAQTKNLRKVLFHYGKEYLCRKLETGTTNGLFQLVLHSEIGPEAYPCDPATIDIEMKRWQTVEVISPHNDKPERLYK